MSRTEHNITTDSSKYPAMKSCSPCNKPLYSFPSTFVNNNNTYPSFQQAIITDLSPTNSITSTPNANNNKQIKSQHAYAQKANHIKFEPDDDSNIEHKSINHAHTLTDLIKRELSEFETSDESESESFYSSDSAFSDCIHFNDDDITAPTVLKIEATNHNIFNTMLNDRKNKLLPSTIKCEDIQSVSTQHVQPVQRTKKHWRKYVSLPIECTVCDDYFSSHFQYRNHMRNIHAINRAYKCLQCAGSKDIRYANKSGLQAHIERDHEMIRDYKCTLCPKAFYRKATLERHQRVHDGKKPFECSHCKLRCSQKSSLRQHIVAVHLKLRNYKCRYCGKAFAASTTMKAHMVALHDDDQYARFECGECHKKFYERATYMKHCKIAHRKSHPIEQMIKNGYCPYVDCNKTYTSKNKAASVKYHLVTKHKDQRYANYQCKICDKLFYDKTNYTQHCDAKH